MNGRNERKPVRRRALALGLALQAMAFAGATMAPAQNLGFHTSLQFELTGAPFDILIADYNGDERQDVFVSVVTRARVAVFTNPGDGGLGIGVEARAPPGAGMIASGDFDEDGELDLIVAEFESDYVYFLHGFGDGTFEFPERVLTDHDPTGVEAADMNEDGHLDIVVTTAAEGGGSVNVGLGFGDGTFDYDAQRSRRLPSGSSDVAVGDADGDGDLDVAAPFLIGNAGLLRGDGSGALDRVEILPAGPGEEINRIVFADVDNDDDLDIVVAAPVSGELRILLNDGAGNFADPSSLHVGLGAFSLRAVDFDLDGILDLVTAKTSNNSVAVALGIGDGTFAPPRHFLAPFRPFTADAADIDGDGFVDVVAASQTQSGGTTHVIYGSSSGILGIETFLEGLHVRPQATVATDVDGDGALELIVGLATPPSIAVLAPRAGGGFDAPRTVVEGEITTALRTGDLNGDRLVDIVATVANTPRLDILLGIGEGEFAAPASFELLEPLQSIALGDLDDDGSLDVVGTPPSTAAPAAVVLFGDGAGSFAAPVALDLTGVPLAPAVVDINGDGRLDIAVTNGAEPVISTRYGLGERMFSELSAIATAAAPLAAAWSDIDGDGHVDVAYGSLGAVRILYGAGSEPFVQGPVLSVDGSVSAIAIRDLTGDGRPDIAATAGISNSFWAFANGGSRTDFAEQTAIDIGSNPAALLIADIDADGRYDAVAVGDVLWLLSNRAALASPRGNGNGDGLVSAADIIALLRLPVSAKPIAVESAGPDTALGIDTNGDGWVDDTDLRGLPRRLFAP